MTEDWRKELGLDNDDYKWQMDNRFKIPDEEFFCHEFLRFLENAKAYQIKRKLMMSLMMICTMLRKVFYGL